MSPAKFPANRLRVTVRPTEPGCGLAPIKRDGFGRGQMGEVANGHRPVFPSSLRAGLLAFCDQHLADLDQAPQGRRR